MTLEQKRYLIFIGSQRRHVIVNLSTHGDLKDGIFSYYLEVITLYFDLCNTIYIGLSVHKENRSLVTR